LRHLRCLIIRGFSSAARELRVATIYKTRGRGAKEKLSRMNYSPEPLEWKAFRKFPTAKARRRKERHAKESEWNQLQDRCRPCAVIPEISVSIQSFVPHLPSFAFPLRLRAFAVKGYAVDFKNKRPRRVAAFS
jgi:hypothetical protein